MCAIRSVRWQVNAGEEDEMRRKTGRRENPLACQPAERGKDRSSCSRQDRWAQQGGRPSDNGHTSYLCPSLYRAGVGLLMLRGSHILLSTALPLQTLHMHVYMLIFIIVVRSLTAQLHALTFTSVCEHVSYIEACTSNKPCILWVNLIIY